MKLLTRLQQIKPTYDAMNWEKQRETLEKLIVSKCRYHYVLNSDQRDNRSIM